MPKGEFDGRWRLIDDEMWFDFAMVAAVDDRPFRIPSLPCMRLHASVLQRPLSNRQIPLPYHDQSVSSSVAEMTGACMRTMVTVLLRQARL